MRKINISSRLQIAKRCEAPNSMCVSFGMGLMKVRVLLKICNTNYLLCCLRLYIIQKKIIKYRVCRKTWLRN